MGPLKVSCALAVILLPGLYLSMIHQTVAMSLGIVAGAIAEPDDSLSGRIKSLLLTLACFWIATLSVQLLFPYPWLFAAGLFCSTWFFIMLGGLIYPGKQHLCYGHLIKPKNLFIKSHKPRLPDGCQHLLGWNIFG